jgi:arylsulfatase A-like enzyme
MDLYTTLIELAGEKVPSDRPVDGLNIMPLLAGSGGSPRESIVYYRGKAIHAVRLGEWKAHFFKVESLPAGFRVTRKCNPPELYHLANDLSEEKNLADQLPEFVSRLTSFAEEFRNAVVPGKRPSRKYLPF